METEVCTQLPSPEESFLQALTGQQWVAAVDSMGNEQRTSLASRATALVGEELDALELVGRLANSIQLGCDDAIDVQKLGSLVMAMARRAKLYREVAGTVRALQEYERVHGRPARAATFVS